MEIFRNQKECELCLAARWGGAHRRLRIRDKLAVPLDRRSLRELQNLLLKIMAQYRGAHKRYSQIHGFSLMPISAVTVGNFKSYTQRIPDPE